MLDVIINHDMSSFHYKNSSRNKTKQCNCQRDMRSDWTAHSLGLDSNESHCLSYTGIHGSIASFLSSYRRVYMAFSCCILPSILCHWGHL